MRSRTAATEWYGAGMKPEGPRSSLAVTGAAALTAVGVCCVAASVMAPLALGPLSAWVLAGVGVAALVVGLGVLSVVFARRDRDLR